MESMTGYGEASAASEGWRFKVRIRSVNHRSLDLVLRLPEPCRREEEILRRRLGERLHRGHVELGVDARAQRRGGIELAVDAGAVEQLAAAAVAWEAAGWTEGRLRPGDLLRLPDVVMVQAADAAWEDADRAALQEAFEAALEELVAVRQREGAVLATVLGERLEELRAIRERLVAGRRTVREQTAADLRSRVGELLADVEIDSARLAQEVAYLVDRGDVQEELDRLGAHLDRLQELLVERGPVGKRLDFLGQEIGRELNTVGSKVRDAALAHLIVLGKTACERLREQALNLA